MKRFLLTSIFCFGFCFSAHQAEAEPWICPSDYNSDCCLMLNTRFNLLEYYYVGGPYHHLADMNDDGEIDFTDFLIISEAVGRYNCRVQGYNIY